MRRAAGMRRTPPARQGLPSLEEVERGRRQLWSVTFVLLFGLSLAVVVVSYWRDRLPDAVADALGYSAVRFVFLALSLGFALYVIDRERTFRSLTRALIEANARSLALEERLRESSALQRVVTALNSSLELEQVLQEIVRSARELVNASEGAIMLLDAERGVLSVAASTGLPGGLGAGEFPVGQDLAGAVAETRLATLVPTAAEVARYPWLSGRGITSSMCAPLTMADELIGTLLVSASGGRSFAEYDLRVLMLFAEQAAVAISNAQAYRRERESVSRLAEMDRLKTDFVATITHELKTPLTSLLGYASILRRPSDALSPEQREECFEIMARQGERILRLIEELLQSSRIESGAAKLRRDRLDLGSLVKEVEVGVASMARGHTLIVEVPDYDLGLFGDPTAIEHVLTNLLDNAIKYSQPGTVVRLRVEERDSEILISVADQGIGISQDDLPHIFERFRQAPGEGRTRTSVGLGLYIARSLVTAHGGRIWAESSVGKGTTFTIALPRRRPRDEGGPLQDAFSLQDAEQPGRLLD